MKRLILFSLIVVAAFAIASSSVNAAERAPLGNGNLAVKLDYIDFTEDALKNSDVDTGLYIGLEGYGNIAQNLYLGGEVGYANPEGNAFGLDTELTFVPIEMNLKYVAEGAPNLDVDFGIGISFNYAEEKASGFGASASVDDWVFGGQLFADLNYKINKFFLGINAKYQLTEEPEFEFMGYTIEPGYDYSNWRIGGQVGIIF